jgi:glycosyltransferase involved in cell wall biosynthesis
MRLAIVTSHPIQYNAPFFRELSRRPGVDLRVFYGWEGPSQSGDPEFGRSINWDIPLLDGYEWELVPNRASDPGTHHFRGIDNPDAVARILAWRPDAVLVFGWSFRTHLGVMRHFKGRIPVLFRGDSTLQSGGGARLKRMLRIPALRWVYRHVDVALYPGQRNREYLRACGVDEARMAWMPHAIDTARFGDDRVAEAAALERTALGIGPDDLAFLFAGKFVPRKECELLIDAFRDAAGREDRVHLVLVGDGPLESHLRTIAADLPRLHFVGFRNQTQMPAAYRIGDCFVLPSHTESWGLGINEAMAAGRTVIASDRVGACPDLVADRCHGQVFASGDVEALSVAIRRFILPRSDLLSLGGEARKAIAAWSIPSAADALVDVLQGRRLLGCLDGALGPHDGE